MNEPQPIVVANFKAHKSWDEMSAWIEQVAPKCNEFGGTIILCPSAPFLAAAYSKLNPLAHSGSEPSGSKTGGQNSKLRSQNSALKLGVQDISKFEEGPYTGEISASQLKKICQYAIVGHSERRKYFAETDGDVIQKVDLLLKSEITPILCVSDLKQLDAYVNEGKTVVDNAQKIIFVYEPPSAISKDRDYRPEDPQVADQNVAEISRIFNQNVVTLYGGSINPENIKAFLSKENIAGGLVGQACLDADTFLQLISKSA